MNKTGLIKLATKLVELNPDNLKDPDGYFVHLEGAYNVAQDIVNEITAKYPKIPLIVEEVSLAAGLHDIGRPLREDQLFHELRGAQYIEDFGLEEGVADTEIDVYRIAQMFRPHGTVYERWNDPENAEHREEFEPIDMILLLPRTWQEAIVAFSDVGNEDRKRVDVRARLEEVLKKYETDPKYKSEMTARAIRSGTERLIKLSERVEALADGKLTEKEILRYGFL
jgi:hypothetical protein